MFLIERDSWAPKHFWLFQAGLFNFAARCCSIVVITFFDKGEVGDENHATSLPSELIRYL
jgi:hypothetical protein